MHPTLRLGLVSAVAGTIILGSVALLPQSADAAFIQFNSRAAFDAEGPFIAADWGAFGPDGTQIITPDSRTYSGLEVGVSSSQGTLRRSDEGTSFTGTFSPGDHLLTDDNSESDSFIVRFGTLVKGFGTQIDAHFQTGAFTGFIEVFGAGDVLLFTANYSGTATSAEDNSAPFVGIESDSANISFAKFWIDQPDPALPDASGALAINRLDILVPEPADLALFAPALLGLAWARRRRGQSRS